MALIEPGRKLSVSESKRRERLLQLMWLSIRLNNLPVFSNLFPHSSPTFQRDLAADYLHVYLRDADQSTTSLDQKTRPN